MKFQLYVLFFFVGVVLNSFGQYKPMLDFKNEWHVTYCYNGCNTNTYYTDGDTLVDGMNYKVLDGYHFISRTFLLRENTTERRVYLTKIEPTKNTTFLLYDFSLSVGDTMELLNPSSPYPVLAGFFQLDSIKMKPLVDGQNYRHFFLQPTPSNPNNSGTVTWIEGVGSQGLINTPGGKAEYNGIGRLTCFYKNADLFYSETDSIVGCSETISIGLEALESKTSIAVFPNPTSSKITVNHDLGAINLHVVSVEGKLLKTFQLKESTTDVDLNLTSGMYLLFFETLKHGQIKKSIVVQ